MNFFGYFKSEIKLSLVVALVAIILVVGGILLLRNDVRNQVSPTPTPQPQTEILNTSDWQIYEGVYPIRFSYPKNLKLSSGDADIFSTIRLWSPLREDKDSEFTILMPSDFSADEVIKNLEKDGFTREKEFFIDGFQATQLKGFTTPNTYIAARMATKVIVRVNGQVYSITNWRADENEGVFQRLVSSIRFTENSVTESVASWQTYRSDEFGFEVKYPSAWNVRKAYDFVSFEPPDIDRGENAFDANGVVLIMVEKAPSFVKTDSDAIALFQAFMDSCSPETPSSCDEKTSDVYRFEKQVMVAGKVGFQTSGGCCLDIGRHIFVYNKDNRYRITLYADSLPKSTWKNEDVFNQILATFRFVNYPQIQTLEIIPSEKSNEGVIYYQEGAKAIATGVNLSKVEFRQRGGGQIYTSPEGGLIGVGTMTYVESGEQKWEVLLPSERTMLTLCGVGFDSAGDKVDEVCIHNILPADSL